MLISSLFTLVMGCGVIQQQMALAEGEKNKALDEAVLRLSANTRAEERSYSGRMQDAQVIKNSNAPNPPPKSVKGIIEKVDPSGLVLISIGTDQGVNVNHTLEVYRLQPRPEYLGMIRVTDVNAHKGVGRLMRSANRPQTPTLREGDEVASSLRPQR